MVATCASTPKPAAHSPAGAIAPAVTITSSVLAIPLAAATVVPRPHRSTSLLAFAAQPASQDPPDPSSSASAPHRPSRHMLRVCRLHAHRCP